MVASVGIRSVPEGPAASMRSPRMSTTQPLTARSAVPSQTRSGRSTTADACCADNAAEASVHDIANTAENRRHALPSRAFRRIFQHPFHHHAGVPMSRFVRPTGAVLLLALAAACQGGTGSAARIPADSTEYYRTQTQQLSTISSQKDSLLTELSETTKLITDVSAELATIRTDSRNTPVVGT